jgi:hypothetical protein
MAARLLALCVDAHDPPVLGAFWAGLLGRRASADGATVLPGAEPEFALRFVPSAVEKVGPNWLHPHLTSAAGGDQERTVALALGLGATHLEVGQRPEEGHIVLGDPEGNELCVIEAGNRFLAGCGFLGELACDGTREVGLFWSAALGWPLNWDQDEETSIQSPLGGTKLSWGGPPVAPKVGRDLRFELGADDLAAEVGRLVSLGATRLGDLEHGQVLADPDGNEFLLRPA